MSALDAVTGAAGGAPAFPLTGVDARWLLSFQHEDATGTPTGDPLDIGCDDYAGEISATLPAGLEAGAYRFVVKGMSDAHYAAVKLAENATERVTLYLYWGDGGGGGALAGYAKNLLGIGPATPASAQLAGARVATLAVTKVERAASDLTYDVTITARARMFDVLSRLQVCGATIVATTFHDLFRGVLGRIDLVENTDWKYYDAATEATSENAVKTGRTALSWVQAMAAKLEAASPDKHGRGMFLQRYGVLHVGPRPIPLEGVGTAPTVVDESNGLIELQETARVAADPNYQLCKPDGTRNTAAARTHGQYKLTCKGRPDVKPGDLIAFAPAPPDDGSTQGGGIVGAVQDLVSSLGGASSAAPGSVTMYVESVDHKLSRANGFVTTVTGTQVTDADHVWDTHTVTTPGAPRPQAPTAAATPEARVADALVRQVRRLFGEANGPEVGEVRATAVDGDAPLTLTVWQGLDPAQNDADPGQARRLDVQRPSGGARSAVPYLTPFAWGSCGLMLPQYPGSRVLVDTRNGMADDPLVLGSLWQAGHVPANAKAGDWWLKLPTAVPNPATVPDTWTPSDFSGSVTNDLIDGNGVRTIEVKQFALTAGDLKGAGARPEAPPADVALQLKLVAGGNTASVALKTDGSIEISSSAGISITSQGDLDIKAANVNINAKTNVRVTVGGTMDVSKG
jgi:hypothetical protein